MLKSELEYMLEDQGLRIKTEKGDVIVTFDQTSLDQLTFLYS